MRKLFRNTLSALMILSAIFVAGSAPTLAAARPTRILAFDTMVGVPQALTGTQAPIRGINGGGIPWTLDAASGELRASGHLKVSVRGLVLAAGANAGSNPVASFRAVVSCLGSDGSIQNIQTAAFPATTGPASAGGGDSEIETDVTLPQPCIAPIIFVTSPGGSWFAVTGH